MKKGETLTFTIRNMGNQTKLYKVGLKPVFRVMPHHSKSWKRINSNLSYEMMNEGFTITWTTKFDWDSSEKCYFAWTFPSSFKESLDKTLSLQEKYGTDGRKSKTTYFKREILSYSYERRPVEMFTLSSKLGLTEEREEYLPNLFPEGGSRPYKFEGKKTIFLSSRVHPGETPAQHVLHGILNFLTNENNAQAR